MAAADPADPADPATDPRPSPSDQAPPIDSQGDLRPAVAGREGRGSAWLIGGGAGLLGLIAFLWLGSHRPGPPRDLRSLAAPDDGAAPLSAAPAPPPEIAALEAAARNPPSPPVVSSSPAVAIVTPPPVAPTPVIRASTVGSPADLVARRKAPALVVDLGLAEAAAKSAAAAGAGNRPAAPLNGDEQFAARVEAQEPDRSRAVMLRDKASVVPQGAMIPAVLETALNSDLPGFTRAVVSRDVRSFDGSTVLIPRGSRVIGQYKSAALQGQSRAFVIWTRVLRPDGASIQIGSSGADQLGRAGMAGQVDRHFFERFGGAILLSVVNAGATALAGSPSTQVVIGSSQDASTLATTASLLAPGNISPTIKVAQGSPIRIFVARDLDFSPVGAAAP